MYDRNINQDVQLERLLVDPLVCYTTYVGSVGDPSCSKLVLLSCGCKQWDSPLINCAIVLL
jgi:hypothetical protein